MIKAKKTAMGMTLASLVLGMLGSLAACGAKTGASREPDAYEGCATDEVWRTLDEAQQANRVRTDDAQAPRFLQPVTEGATLPGTTPPTIEWQPSSTTAGNANGDATCEKCPTCGTPATLVAPHEAPVAGTVFDLQFSAVGGTPYRVLTTVQSLTVPANVWQSWRGKQVSVTALRAVLTNGELQGDAYRSAQPLSFSVSN
jgi:hypothetical protein